MNTMFHLIGCIAPDLLERGPDNCGVYEFALHATARLVRWVSNRYTGIARTYFLHLSLFHLKSETAYHSKQASASAATSSMAVLKLKYLHHIVSVGCSNPR